MVTAIHCNGVKEFSQPKDFHSSPPLQPSTAFPSYLISFGLVKVDIAIDTAAREHMREVSGVRTVPQLFVDDKYIGVR